MLYEIHVKEINFKTIPTWHKTTPKTDINQVGHNTCIGRRTNKTPFEDETDQNEHSLQLNLSSNSVTHNMGDTQSNRWNGQSHGLDGKTPCDLSH